MEKDNYLLIANHLRDIHHSLESKILNSKTHNPKWEVEKVNETTDMVVELSSLFGLVALLEKLANPSEQSQPTFIYPEAGE